MSVLPKWRRFISGSAQVSEYWKSSRNLAFGLFALICYGDVESVVCIACSGSKCRWFADSQVNRLSPWLYRIWSRGAATRLIGKDDPSRRHERFQRNIGPHVKWWRLLVPLRRNAALGENTTTVKSNRKALPSNQQPGDKSLFRVPLVPLT